jgi:anaerobic ribonucleoside-triphosphate reductase activating protein
LNVAAIKKTDVANGPGIRVSLFVSGCRHACPGCFNAEAWDFHFGHPFCAADETEILNALSSAYIRGFSLLGGEPFEPENVPGLAALVKKIRTECPGKDIWCYSGFTFEELLELPYAMPLLAQLDVLVDGKFIESQKDLNLRFRGSRNQRLIDVAKALQNRNAVEYSL